MEKLKALKLEINKTCKEIQIPNTLEALQKEVGGYIEMPYLVEDFYEMGIDMVINEEGKLADLKPTLAIVSGNKVIDIIYGPVVFVSHDNEGNTISLNKEQRKYLMETVFSDDVAGIQLGDKLEILRYINI